MDALICYRKLREAGFNVKEAAAVMRLSDRQAGRLEAGENVLPLEERHAMSYYMAFVRYAKKWSAAQ